MNFIEMWWNYTFFLIQMYQPMYGQGYPGGYLTGYPTAYGPLQYYPQLAAAAYYPTAAMQPAPVRPTMLVPVSIMQYSHHWEPRKTGRNGAESLAERMTGQNLIALNGF